MYSARFALRVRVAALIVFVLAFAPAMADAGPVQFLPQPLPHAHDPLDTLAPVAIAPGEHAGRIVDFRFDNSPVADGHLFAYDPSWDLLDRIDTPYTMDFSPFTKHDGVFTSAVFRNPATGNLIFADFFDDREESDKGILTMSGFGDFQTDVTGLMGETDSPFNADRSADGSAIALTGEVIFGAGDLFVGTDAKFFDRKGTTTMHREEQFSLDDPPFFVIKTSDLSFTSFEPIHAVPLPPAVWSALSALALGLGVKVVRAKFRPAV